MESVNWTKTRLYTGHTSEVSFAFYLHYGRGGGRGMRWDKDNTVATGSRLSGDDTFLSGQNSIDKPAFYSLSPHSDEVCEIVFRPSPAFFVDMD